jgi:hypothetical protein
MTLVGGFSTESGPVLGAFVIIAVQQYLAGGAIVTRRLRGVGVQDTRIAVDQLPDAGRRSNLGWRCAPERRRVFAQQRRLTSMVRQYG